MPTELRVEMTRRPPAAITPGSRRGGRATSPSFLPYLRTNVELKRRYVECFEWADSPVHAAPRRLRARDDDDRGARGVRGAPPGADRARREPRRRSTRRSSTATSPPTRSGASRERVVRTLGFERRRLAARSDRAPVLHVVLEPRRPPDDALPAGRPRVGLVDDARGGPRAVRPRHRRLADAHAARGAPSLGHERVAEPHLGEPRRPLAGRSGRTGTSRCRRPSRSARRRRARHVRAARSTAPSPA